MKKIVTHGGQFHADEILAIAILLNHFNKKADEVEITRTFNVNEEDLKDEDVYVLDIGKNFDRTRNNYDHHHNELLPACSTLVAAQIYGVYSDVLKLLRKYLLDSVSDIDCGIIPNGGPTEHFNSLIRSLNSCHDGFGLAIELALITLKGQLATVHRTIDDRKRWDKEVSELNKDAGSMGMIRFHPEKNPIVGWKEIAEEEGVMFLITPNTRSDGWNVISRDTNIATVTDRCNHTFRHNSGVMAVYPYLNDAIQAAIQSEIEMVQ